MKYTSNTKIKHARVMCSKMTSKIVIIVILRSVPPVFLQEILLQL